MSFVGCPGQAGRYVSGLCVAALGLCAAGWLALAPVAFGYRGADRAGVSLHRAAWADWATAAALALVSLVTLACWVVAWRRRLRADGIVAPPSRRQARRETRAQRRREHDGDGAARTPDPAQVLSELRALLTPLLPESPEPPVPSGPAEPAESAERVRLDENHRPGAPAVPHPRSGGLAAIESMLAGAELLMVGCGEEEAW
jgi:hypothetical protein